MIHKETSRPEKIIKLFPNENIVLNKKFNSRKPDIWFKDCECNIEVDEGNHKNYNTDDENEEKKYLKDIILNFFDVIPMILILIFLNL